jgi:hypothetical protein
MLRCRSGGIAAGASHPRNDSVCVNWSPTGERHTFQEHPHTSGPWPISAAHCNRRWATRSYWSGSSLAECLACSLPGSEPSVAP